MNFQVNALRHLFAACGLALLFTSTTAAAEPLAWKFAPGLTNRYRMTQDTQLTINSGATGDAKTHSVLTIDISWTVQKVNDDGSAVLKQQIDRMRIRVETGDPRQEKLEPTPDDRIPEPAVPKESAVQVAEIDSASKEDPQGQAATLVPLLKALSGNPFTVTMTARGEVKDVEVSEAIVEALKNQPGAAQMGDLATPEGFKKLVGQASFVLPEKLEPGVTWTAKSETDMPAVGTQTATTTYRYEGPREVDGKVMEAFSATLDVSFAGGQIPVEITNQESKGEILFNRNDGRLESSGIKQLTEWNLTVSGQAIKQKIDNNVAMKWVPENEEKDE